MVSDTMLGLRVSRFIVENDGFRLENNCKSNKHAIEYLSE